MTLEAKRAKIKERTANNTSKQKVAPAAPSTHRLDKGSTEPLSVRKGEEVAPDTITNIITIMKDYEDRPSPAEFGGFPEAELPASA